MHIIHAKSITMHFFIQAMQNLESVEPSKEPPSTLEPVIELKNKRSPESTITAVVNAGIKAMEERNKPIGEVLISQHSLDGTVDTNDDRSEHGADGKQHIDLIQVENLDVFMYLSLLSPHFQHFKNKPIIMLQEVVKVYQNDKTTEQEEKVIEQDFESRQREASCEKKIQLGADDTIDRTPDCDQIITGGSLSEEVCQNTSPGFYHHSKLLLPIEKKETKHSYPTIFIF